MQFRRVKEAFHTISFEPISERLPLKSFHEPGVGRGDVTGTFDGQRSENYVT